MVFYYGHYAHVVRGRRRKSQTQRQALDQGLDSHPDESTLSPQRKAALRRRWAHLIRRVFEVDPLVCPQCAGPLRAVAFITEPRVIRRILDHLTKRNRHHRAPPQQRQRLPQGLGPTRHLPIRRPSCISSRNRHRYQHIPFPALPRLCYFPDVPRPKRSRGRELSSFCSRGHGQISYKYRGGARIAGGRPSFAPTVTPKSSCTFSQDRIRRK